MACFLIELKVNINNYKEKKDCKHFQIKCNQISQICKREIHSKKKELDACLWIELKLNVNIKNYKKKGLQTLPNQMQPKSTKL